MKSAAIISLLFTFFGYTFDLTPNVPVLLVSVVLGMGLDFITGVIKAKFKKQERTSEGYRRTVKKVTQYFTAIGLCLGIQYLIKQTVSNANGNLQYISLFVFLFIIYIEITSILENLNEIDNRSLMSKFFIRPLLFIMKFGLEKNPLIQAKDRLNDKDADVVKDALDKVKNDPGMMPVLLAGVILLSGCMTDKKMAGITAAYNKKHPELQAKDCMEKFPPKTGTVKTGTEQLFKVETVTDSAAEKLLQGKIEKLTNDLIAAQMSSPNEAVTPDAVREMIEQSLLSAMPAGNNTIERHFYTRVDTLPVADSAAIFWWKFKYENCNDKLVKTETERDSWKQTAAERKKLITKLWLAISGILLIVLLYILKRLKVF